MMGSQRQLAVHKTLRGEVHTVARVTLRKMRIAAGDVRGCLIGKAFISCDWVGRIRFGWFQSSTQAVGMCP